MESLLDPIKSESRLVGTLITREPHKWSGVVTTLVILLMSLLSQLYWQDWGDLASELPAVGQKIFAEGEWWRAVTALFIHGDMGHFLNNMYMLGVFGYFCFGYFGFQIFPLFTFLGAVFANVIAIATYPPDVQLLGASGWVYLLGGLWLTLYFLIQRQYSYFNRTLRVVGVALMMFFPTSFVVTTSYRTHAIGFFVGVAIALVYFGMQRSYIRSWEQWRYIAPSNDESDVKSTAI
jgi:rhomboid protease GluP